VDFLENRYLIAQERYKDFVAECAADAKKPRKQRQGPSLFHTLARLCGHLLLKLGLILLRYGKAEAKYLVNPYQAPIKPADLN
jgi:hypothetical protein